MTDNSKESAPHDAQPTPSERVPICGSRGTATVSRAIWDEAWLAYGKKYGYSQSQHDRLLREGFYAEELDADRPGWRPVDQRIQELESALALKEAELAAAIRDRNRLLAERAGIVERCAKVCERVAERRFNDYGIRELDTNATYYPKHIADECDARDEEDNFCAALIRSLHAQAEAKGEAVAWAVSDPNEHDFSVFTDKDEAESVALDVGGVAIPLYASPQAAEDSARLNFLLHNDCRIAHSRDGEVCWLVFYDENGDIVYPHRGSYGTPRDAIDAARAQGGGR